MDLALTVQKITELTMEKQVRHVKKITGADYLCMAGGVALNCVSNGKILRQKSSRIFSSNRPPATRVARSGSLSRSGTST